MLYMYFLVFVGLFSFVGNQGELGGGIGTALLTSQLVLALPSELLENYSAQVTDLLCLVECRSQKIT